mmetsp:Transcript_9878/g.19760  ORF Transcript_9878/g.19760 Transcript_9878/m.19760 type:complete len:376 (-) Transcript_9878:594-1721(-)
MNAIVGWGFVNFHAFFGSWDYTRVIETRLGHGGQVAFSRLVLNVGFVITNEFFDGYPFVFYCMIKNTLIREFPIVKPGFNFIVWRFSHVFVFPEWDEARFRNKRLTDNRLTLLRSNWFRVHGVICLFNQFTNFLHNPFLSIHSDINSSQKSIIIHSLGNLIQPIPQIGGTLSLIHIPPQLFQGIIHATGPGIISTTTAQHSIHWIHLLDFRYVTGITLRFFQNRIGIFHGPFQSRSTDTSNFVIRILLATSISSVTPTTNHPFTGIPQTNRRPRPQNIKMTQPPPLPLPQRLPPPTPMPPFSRAVIASILGKQGPSVRGHPHQRPEDVLGFFVSKALEGKTETGVPRSEQFARSIGAEEGPFEVSVGFVGDFFPF